MCVYGLIYLLCRTGGSSDGAGGAGGAGVEVLQAGKSEQARREERCGRICGLSITRFPGSRGGVERSADRTRAETKTVGRQAVMWHALTALVGDEEQTDLEWAAGCAS